MNSFLGTRSRTKITPWNFDVYIVTWNVGTKYPDQISLTNLLGLGKNPGVDEHLPDIYAIGLQEVNSQPQNQVLGIFKEDQWTMKFKEILKERDYVAVKTEQMQGLLLILFAKREHLLHLRNIESEFTRTGFGGIWGNKGAVSIRMNMYGCAVSFVVAHLAAHDHELDERVADYKQILENHHYHVKKYKHIFDHDYVFWFGDLNFRLTGNDSPEEIRELIEQDKISELIQRDQLLLVRETNRAFWELEERLPEFPPTFKFKEGTSKYDLKRRPAWTDRVLYTVQQNKYPNITLNLDQKSYKSHPGYNISDHKPVSSEFVIRINRHLPKLRLLPQNDSINTPSLAEQVFESPDETTIEFSYIPIWTIGEEHRIEYWLPKSFKPENSDWIGIFKQDFASLTEYVAYEYINQAECRLNSDRTDYNLCSLRIEFPENIELHDGESYLLIYFKNTGIRGVTSVAGMSNVFRAERRPPSPRFDEVD